MKIVLEDFILLRVYDSSGAMTEIGRVVEKDFIALQKEWSQYRKTGRGIAERQVAVWFVRRTPLEGHKAKRLSERDKRQRVVKIDFKTVAKLVGCDRMRDIPIVG